MFRSLPFYCNHTHDFLLTKSGLGRACDCSSDDIGFSEAESSFTYQTQLSRVFLRPFTCLQNYALIVFNLQTLESGHSPETE